MTRGYPGLKMLKYRFYYMPVNPRGERMTVALYASNDKAARQQFNDAYGHMTAQGKDVEIKCEGEICQGNV